MGEACKLAGYGSSLSLFLLPPTHIALHRSTGVRCGGEHFWAPFCLHLLRGRVKTRKWLERLCEKLEIGWGRLSSTVLFFHIVHVSMGVISDVELSILGLCFRRCEVVCF